MVMLSVVKRSRKSAHGRTEFRYWNHGRGRPSLRVILPSCKDQTPSQIDVGFFNEYSPSTIHLGTNLPSGLLGLFVPSHENDSKLSSLRWVFSSESESDYEAVLQIISQNPLTRFDGKKMKSEIAKSVFEVIQWDFLLTLCIEFTHDDHTGALQSLVDCVCRPANPITTQLKMLGLYFPYEITLKTRDALLQLVSALPLKELAISGSMDTAILMSILEVINSLRLRWMYLESPSIGLNQCEPLLDLDSTIARLLHLSLKNHNKVPEDVMEGMVALGIVLEKRDIRQVTDRWFQ